MCDKIVSKTGGVRCYIDLCCSLGRDVTLTVWAAAVGAARRPVGGACGVNRRSREPI